MRTALETLQKWRNTNAMKKLEIASLQALKKDKNFMDGLYTAIEYSVYQPVLVGNGAFENPSVCLLTEELAKQYVYFGILSPTALVVKLQQQQPKNLNEFLKNYSRNAVEKGVKPSCEWNNVEYLANELYEQLTLFFYLEGFDISLEEFYVRNHNNEFCDISEVKVFSSYLENFKNLSEGVAGFELRNKEDFDNRMKRYEIVF